MKRTPPILKKLAETTLVKHMDIILDNYDHLTAHEIKLLLAFYQATLHKLQARDRVRGYELVYLFTEFNGQVEKLLAEIKKDKN